MKNAKKIVALLLCAVLLVGASVMGTLAYMTSQAEVTNTFTVGKVTLGDGELGSGLDEAFVNEYGELLYDTGTEDENGDPIYTTDSTKGTLADRVTANQYKLVPGHEYIKDPTIHVGEDSEECYLFAKIDNGLGEHATIAISTGWTQIAGTNYWQYANKVAANTDVEIFGSFTYAADATDTEIEEDKDKNITVTAYAIQADGFNNVDAAWEALKDQETLN